MRFSFKRWSSSHTRSLWLISHIIILKNAVAAIAGSPDSAPPYLVNFSIPQNCTKGSELRDPHQRVIAKFERTLFRHIPTLKSEEGCNDLSHDTGCHISGSVSESGIYQLHPLNNDEKFQTCNRLFHVQAATTTSQPSTTPRTTPSPATNTRITMTVRLTSTTVTQTSRPTLHLTSTTVTQTSRPTLHLTSTTVTQTSRPTLHLTSTTRKQTKALTLSSKRYEVVATDQNTDTEKKTMPWFVYIVIGVISLVACILGITVFVQCRRNKHKSTTGKEEHGGIPAPAENLDYMERESTGTYAEIELPQPESDYVVSASVNHLIDVMDSHCATSAANVYLTPIGERHNPHSEEYEMVEHTESDNYEKLQQTVEAFNQYETTCHTSYSTLDDKMRRTGRAGSSPGGGHFDMASSLRDTVEDDYLKPLSIKQKDLKCV